MLVTLKKLTKPDSVFRAIKIKQSPAIAGLFYIQKVTNHLLLFTNHLFYKSNLIPCANGNAVP